MIKYLLKDTKVINKPMRTSVPQKLNIYKMKLTVITLIAVFAHTTIFGQEGSLQAELPVIKTSKAFKQMEEIVGKWKGKMKQSDGKIIDVETEYKVIANGSAISQILIEDGLEMLTIFNDRNGTLGATHYCVLGNQPTLVLSNNTKTSLSFDFDPICGLKAGKDRFFNKHKISYNPEKPNVMIQTGAVINEDRTVLTSRTELKRVK